MRRSVAFLLVVVGLSATPPARADRPVATPAGQTVPASSTPSSPAPSSATLSPDQIERFLEKAEITDSRPIGKGITHPWRLTLRDGATTHDAAFQSVDRERENVRFKGGREEKLFRDYYGYNIAAYKLARLLGYDDLVPVSVERRWKGQTGALTWWIEKKWDEDERLKAKVEPPNRDAWERQVYLARIFTALVEDTDRNLGNQLVTADFHLWMIDFTRAFRRSSTLDKSETLRKIDRSLYERLKTLESKAISDAVKPWLDREEVQALLSRQRALVSHFTKIAAERGEQFVFY